MTEEKKKKKPKQALGTFVRGILRRGSFHWKARQEALEAARIERGQYRCAMCNGIFKRDQITLDHIEPVINPKTGFVSWDDYINRLYCPAEGFQCLCPQCDEAKMNLEDQLRSQYKTERDNLPDLTKEKKYSKRKKKDNSDE